MRQASRMAELEAGERRDLSVCRSYRELREFGGADSDVRLELLALPDEIENLQSWNINWQSVMHSKSGITVSYFEVQLSQCAQLIECWKIGLIEVVDSDVLQRRSQCQ